MNTQDAALWREIEDLFDHAAELPDAQRRAYVERMTVGRETLRTRVLQLLQAEQNAGEFLQSGPSVGAAPAPAAARPDETIGPWKIHSLLGRGGMGEVYRAERADGLYRQTVALKLLQLDQPELAVRFEGERQILAQMNHPNIARLIDGGVSDDGRPYMAMEYVQGRNLGAYLHETDLDLRLRLQLFVKICAAVAYAHGHLVVHRDIKPDNILIDHSGEPKLLDFGIAKLTAEGMSAEHTQVLATPNFAAPEQLCGGAITTATDVYGLGATLYFLLCEQPPLTLNGISLPQMLDRLAHAPPVAPSRRVEALRASSIRGDLDAICAKAMAKAPSQRYATATELADDIARHQRHEAVQARPPSLGYRLGRALWRHKLAYAAAIAVTLSLLLGLATTSYQAHIAGIERDNAKRDAARLSSLRSSILRLFRTAASELDSDQLTARALFSQSAQNIERDFGNNPATAAALMQMLGEMQLVTEDYAAARVLLERAHDLQQQGIDDEILAAIRIDLAHLAYRDGDYPRARALYEQASRIWQQRPERFVAERIAGLTLASQLARAEGSPDQAVALLRQAASAARVYWGEAHEETGIVLINLAAALYYANDLPAALAGCAEAWAVWQAIDRTHSPDALNLLANWGLFALRHGDPIAGEKRLAEALELRSRLYGASAAQATLMKNLGVAHRLNGRNNAGMRLLEQAEWMARKYAGPGGRLHTSAVYALARALIEDGLLSEARARLELSLSTGEEKRIPWRYLNQALLASLMTEPAGRDPAQQLFEQSIQGLRELGAGSRTLLADAQRLQARWLARHGEPATALGILQQSLTNKLATRRAGHYEVLRLQQDQALLLQQLGQTVSAQQLIQATRRQAITELGAEHPLARSIIATQL